MGLARPSVKTIGIAFGILGMLFLAFAGLVHLLLADSALDIHVHDTYFITGFAYLFGVPAVLFLLSGPVYLFLPRVSGGPMHKTTGQVHLALTLLAITGYILTFLSMRGLVMSGGYYATHGPSPWLDLLGIGNILMTIGVAGQSLLIVNVARSFAIGARAKRS